MRRALLPALILGLSILAAASPAAAQSCATLGGRLDCGAAPAKKPAGAPPPALPGRDVEGQGHAEVEVSNRGSSVILNSRAIDSHGVVEFGFRGSTRGPCRRSGYGTLCD